MSETAGTPSDRRPMLAVIKAEYEKSKLSQRKFANKIGTSDSYFSDYLNKPDFVYAHKVEEAFEKWRADDALLREHRTSKNPQFIGTRPSTVTVDALIQIRAMRDTGVIYGKGGTGKTEGIKELVARHPDTTSVFRAMKATGRREQWAVERFVKVASGLRGKPTGAEAIVQFREKRATHLLVFDDAQLLSRSAIEYLVFFGDDAKLAIAFVGNPSLIPMLECMSDQVWSRIGLKELVRAEYLDGNESVDGYKPEEIKQFVLQRISSPSAAFLKECQRIAKDRGHLRRLEKLLDYTPKLISACGSDVAALKSAEHRIHPSTFED